MSGGGSFFYFCRLCERLGDEASYLAKTALIKTEFDNGHFDTYLLAKLLMTKEDKRIYHLADKNLVKVFAKALETDDSALLEQLLKTGDVGKVASTAWKSRSDLPAKSTLTLREVDDFLTACTKVTKRADQAQLVVKHLWSRAIASDILWLCRLITHDLRINVGAKYILEALHPDGFRAFKKTSNLKLVVDKIKDHSLDVGDGDEDDAKDDGDNDGGAGPKKKAKLSKKLSVGMQLSVPVKPMLAKATKSFEDAVKRCPAGMAAEIKYDGERLQIHKNGDEFRIFSRNLKPVPEWKTADVKKYLPLSTSADKIVLDCEVLLVDHSSGQPLPFGTFNVHKKNAFADANPCLFIFDILYLNGASLIDEPFSKRRAILESNVTVVKNRIHVSELYHPKSAAELKGLMTTVMHKKLEGLIIKSEDGVYQPAARHWLKMKKDYLEDGAMADSADLLVLGAFFGSGAKGGLLTTLLMGVRDETGLYRTVCKCGNGLTDKELDDLQAELQKTMKPWAGKMANISVDNKYAPDFVVAGEPSIVFEVAGAEFSASNHHTASGISIRFPRFVRRRDDKGVSEATSLAELKALYEASKKTGGGADVQLKTDEEDDDDAPLVTATKKQKTAAPAPSITAAAPAQTSPSVSKKSTPAKPAGGGGSFQYRAICKYDPNCTRVNPRHFAEYAHPAIARPVCEYGSDCKRKNFDHFKEMMHVDET